MQINFGRNGLHHELGSVLSPDDLLVLRAAGGDNYVASVVAIDSTEGDALILRSGHENADRFVAGVIAD